MDGFDQLLTCYDRREISRRELLGAIALLGVGAQRKASAVGQPEIGPGRALNHVSLGVTDLQRSAVFYDRLLHLPVPLVISRARSRSFPRTASYRPAARAGR